MRTILIIICILIALAIIYNVLEWVKENIGIILAIGGLIAIIYFFPYLLKPIIIVVLVGIALFFAVGLISGIMEGTAEARRIKQQKKEQLRLEKERLYEIKNADIDDDVKDIIIKGTDYIKAINHYNDVIPDEELSNDLSSLASVLSKIMDVLKEHPESKKKTEKLTSYYLPTIDKVLAKYAEVEKSTIQNDSTEELKKEIKESIKTINQGMFNLLKQLQETDTLDVSTDLTVIKEMLLRDGLLGDDEK